MSLVPSVSLLCGRQTESGIANFCFIYPSTPMSFCVTRLGTMQQTYLSEYVNFVWQDFVSMQSKHQRIMAAEARPPIYKPDGVS